MTDRVEWLVVPRPVARPRSVIYAIGHAGAGAAPWRSVAPLLPGHVELRAIRLAGREKRFSERPALSVDEQVADLSPKLFRQVTTERIPYVLAGICSGAITAFELCRCLEASARPAALLIAACQASPARLSRSGSPALHSLPAEELRSLLVQRGDVPAFLAEDDDLFEVFEPILRADCEAVETYVYAEEPLLNCPVTAIRATADTLLDHQDVLGWKGVTRGLFSTVERGGSHNLLIAQPEELAAGLNAALDAADWPEGGFEH